MGGHDGGHGGVRGAAGLLLLPGAPDPPDRSGVLRAVAAGRALPAGGAQGHGAVRPGLSGLCGPSAGPQPPPGPAGGRITLY